MKLKLALSAIFLLVLISLTVWGVFTVKEKLEARRQRQQIVLEKKPEVTITIIEGWSVEETVDYLAKKQLGTKQDYEQALNSVVRDDYTFLSSTPKKSSLEGFLFPDTYKINTDSTPAEILEKLLTNFSYRLSQVLDPEMWNKQISIPGYSSIKLNKENNGLTLYEIITLASIIEKETGSAFTKQSKEELLLERKTVAGIFLNRLTTGQALESDATLNYITKSGRAQANFKDLEINSPYNTYKNPGLPPGPICSPSLSSIKAVLEPVKSDYYYFLHTQPEGKVIYSKTFEEHVRNKGKYLK